MRCYWCLNWNFSLAHTSSPRGRWKQIAQANAPSNTQTMGDSCTLSAGKIHTESEQDWRVKMWMPSCEYHLASNKSTLRKMNNCQLADTVRVSERFLLTDQQWWRWFTWRVYDQKATVLITLMNNVYGMFSFRFEKNIFHFFQWMLARAPCERCLHWRTHSIFEWILCVSIWLCQQVCSCAFLIWLTFHAFPLNSNDVRVEPM